MNVVQSKNCIIEVNILGTYYPVFCGKTMEYSQNQEVVEITSVNSAVSREYVAGMTTATLNITGVTVLDNTDGKVSITYLMQEAIRRSPQTMRIRLTDDDGGSLQIAFTALITNNTLSRAVGTYSQSSTSLVITGEPVLSTVVPPPAGYDCPELPLYLDCVAGETSVSYIDLEQTGVEILEVTRSGLQHDETNGTPGNRQFKFTGGTGNGTVEFDPTNPFNEGEVIYVLYKIV